MLLNVFEPSIVKAPAPPWFSVQLNVEPPPTNVLAVAAVMEIVPVPVPAVVVKFVGLALFQTVDPLPLKSKVPPLNVMFFVPELVSIAKLVKVNPFRSTVPFSSVPSGIVRLFVTS